MRSKMLFDPRGKWRNHGRFETQGTAEMQIYRAKEWKDLFTDEAAVEAEQKDTRVRQHAAGQNHVVHVRTRHFDVSVTDTSASAAI